MKVVLSQIEIRAVLFSPISQPTLLVIDGFIHTFTYIYWLQGQAGELTKNW